MRKLIFAFPGMGKTPTCRRLYNCMDLDFGMFRTALDVEKEDESSILNQFVSLINEYLAQGWYVFTNEPKLLDYYSIYYYVPRSKVLMFLPEGKSIHYCAKKLNVSDDLVKEWVAGWAKIAVKNQIKLIYISVGLDHYLNSHPLSLRERRA